MIRRLFRSLSDFASVFCTHARKLLKPFSVIKPYSHQIAAFLYSFSLSLGAVFCFITAKQLPVSIFAVILSCIIFSAAAVLYYSLDLRFSVKAIIWGSVFLLILIFIKPILSDISDVLIRSLYIYGYTSEIFISEAQYNAVIEENSPVTLSAVILSALISFLAAYTVTRRKALWLITAAVSALCLYSCFLFDVLPAVWTIILSSAALVLLFLTQRTRIMDPAEGASQSARLLPIVTAFILVIALISDPVESRRPEFLQKATVQTANFFWNLSSEIGLIEEPAGSSSPIAILRSETIELSELTEQNKMGMTVMAVCPHSESSVIYLRGSSYADYENSQWLSLPDTAAETACSIVPSPLTGSPIETQSSRIDIITEYDHPVIYLPYYAADFSAACAPVGDAHLENTYSLTSYSLYCGSSPNPDTCSAYYRQFVYDNYLSVPDSTARQMRKIALEEEIISLNEYSPGEDIDIPGTADAVCSYVSNAAIYSLSPDIQPEGTDFAVWFITEADSGYCVHFATAATVMLRSLGIPSRYVTGYAKYCPQGQWTSVLSDDAHAWVEYYDPSRGWIPIDPTPISFSSTSAVPAPSSTDISSAPTTVSSSAASSTTVSSGSSAVTYPTSSTFSKPDIFASHVSESGDDPDSSASCTFASVFLILLPFIAAAALPFIRREVIRRRSDSFALGSPASRAEAMYRYICRLERIGGCTSSKQIEALMLKSRFSRHELTEPELSEISGFIDASLEKIRGSANPMITLIHKYILFCY